MGKLSPLKTYRDGDLVHYFEAFTDTDSVALCGKKMGDMKVPGGATVKGGVILHEPQIFACAVCYDKRKAFLFDVDSENAGG